MGDGFSQNENISKLNINDHLFNLLLPEQNTTEVEEETTTEVEEEKQPMKLRKLKKRQLQK